eukprot:CAMPEP_0113925622 /NCGR_PEP_ID=MMETSP1159-20121227/3296_1 /TAXON_ID=88271 /ORGANISM="Picocystis salinarum" /LENGTH=91 /DNA_ID=CAMNT_0000925913 /DNA_START=375 /DNA_END=650 /DNA_ORIENTATION=- /assembly_acc=CAM_ASM_000767
MDHKACEYDAYRSTITHPMSQGKDPANGLDPAPDGLPDALLDVSQIGFPCSADLAAKKKAMGPGSVNSGPGSALPPMLRIFLLECLHGGSK